MVWPITGAESYVGEAGKSMKRGSWPSLEEVTGAKSPLHSKPLAAATKAYSLHALPIYIFDMGCIFEMLKDTASARGAFRSFLESQQTFKPSDLDRITLERRDVEEAVRQALARTQ